MSGLKQRIFGNRSPCHPSSGGRAFAGGHCAPDDGIEDGEREQHAREPGFPLGARVERVVGERAVHVLLDLRVSRGADVARGWAQSRRRCGEG